MDWGENSTTPSNSTLSTVVDTCSESGTSPGEEDTVGLNTTKDPLNPFRYEDCIRARRRILNSKPSLASPPSSIELSILTEEDEVEPVSNHIHNPQ